MDQFKTEQSWSRGLRPGLFGAINYIYIPSPALPCHKYEFHILASSYRFTDVEYTFVLSDLALTRAERVWAAWSWPTFSNVHAFTLRAYRNTLAKVNVIVTARVIMMVSDAIQFILNYSIVLYG